MDFGTLPLEINSARMYFGPGSSPMLAAAAAWDGLAAELSSTASSYQSMISGLISEGWLRPASASMAAAVTPYLTWMSSTGALAEQTAANAAAAAAAFEAAFAMTVSPAVVAANRAELLVLAATNFVGQNTPAIAALEVQYGEMWAQDAAAMYSYAGNSAAAALLTSFTDPTQTTDPAGLAGQAAAVAQVTGTTSSGGTQSTLTQLMSAVPPALQGLMSPASSTSGLGGALGLGGSTPALAASPATPGSVLAQLLGSLDGDNGNSVGKFLNSNLFNGLASAGYANPAVVTPAVTSALSDINSLQSGVLATTLPPGGGFNIPAFTSLMSTQAPAGLSSLGGVSVETARGAFVGPLSVPQSWTAATQVTNTAGTAFPGGSWTSVAVAGGPDVASAGMPGMPGMPLAATAGHGFGTGPRYGFRPTVMPRPPAAG